MVSYCSIVCVSLLLVSGMLAVSQANANKEGKSIWGYFAFKDANTKPARADILEYKREILEDVDKLKDEHNHETGIKPPKDGVTGYINENQESDFDEDYYAALQQQVGLGVIFSKTKPKMPMKDVNEVFDEETQYPEGFNFTKRSRATVLSDTCVEVSDYELLQTAANQYMETVAMHPNTWVYVTRCENANTSCRGLRRNRIHSACKLKKGWVKALVRKTSHGVPYGDYNFEWIAVYRACSCAVAL